MLVDKKAVADQEVPRVLRERVEEANQDRHTALRSHRERTFEIGIFTVRPDLGTLSPDI